MASPRTDDIVRVDKLGKGKIEAIKRVGKHIIYGIRFFKYRARDDADSDGLLYFKESELKDD